MQLLAPACPARPTLQAAGPSATLTGGNAPQVEDTVEIQLIHTKPMDVKATAGTGRDIATAGLFGLGAQLSLLGEKVHLSISFQLCRRWDVTQCLVQNNRVFCAMFLGEIPFSEVTLSTEREDRSPQDGFQI